MAFHLHINTDNAAFQNEDNFGDLTPAFELADILRSVTTALEHGATSGTVSDSNGNTCGEWSMECGEKLNKWWAEQYAGKGQST